jgi:hypothetical protein
MKLMLIVALLLVSAGGAAAQSLGDYARAARKNKTEPSAATRHYDNDNLPTGQTLSVVGPPPAADANTNTADANSAKPPAADPAAAAADRQKAADEWKDKLAQQKQKVDDLNRELDNEQHEVRLRTAAAVLGDPNALSRNGTQPDKDTAQYKSDIEAKQKAIDDARQQLDEMQEQARKAGIDNKENDKDSDKDKDKDKDKN